MTLAPLGFALAAEAPADPQVVGYPSLFVLVTVGTIVPVVPTSAVVSAAAVVAWHAGTPYDLPLVFAVATVAALAGDTVFYWLARRGAGGWLERLRGRVDTPRLDAAQRRLAERGTTVLVLARLVPAGRVPVMLACLGAGWSVRDYVRSDVPAAIAWAASYVALGAVGGSLFAEPWQGLAAVVGLVLLTAVAPRTWRWLRGVRGLGGGPAAQPGDQPSR